MKTAREWFAQLPEPIRSEAMENARDLDSEYDSLAGAITNQFSWRKTPQRHDYWYRIAKKAERGDYNKPTNDKPMRKLKRTDFKRIHDSACPPWKQKLTEKFSDFAFKDEIEVADDFYQEMRKACTSEQHRLFDEIFGAEQKFKVGDHVITKGYTDEYDGRVLKIKRIECGRRLYFDVLDGGYYHSEHNFGFEDTVRHATAEEIAKAQYYPEGTPCLVRDSDSHGWNLRYANGEGSFYTVGRKSGYAKKWNQHMRLDINNLPTS